MITVHILMHRDGDRLAIIDEPWWARPYEWVLDRFCPCCSWRGWIVEKLYTEKVGTLRDKFTGKYYSIWSNLQFWTNKFDKTLYELPVESGCQISLAIFSEKKPCWRDDCEYCWEYRDDAMVVKQNSTKGKPTS